jgi:hypothetical protein
MATQQIYVTPAHPKSVIYTRTAEQLGLRT